MLCVRLRRGARSGCRGGVLSTSTTVVWVLSRGADIVSHLFFDAFGGVWVVAEVVQMEGVEIVGGGYRFGGGVRGVLYAFGQSFNPVVLRLYAKGGANVLQGVYPFFDRADNLCGRFGGRFVLAANQSVIFCKKSIKKLYNKRLQFFCKFDTIIQILKTRYEI